MENQFRDLLNASKKTLQSVFHFPLDAEITPAAGLLGLDKTLKNLLKKKKKEDEVMNPYRASQDLSSIKAAIDQVLAGGTDEVKAEQEVVTIHDIVSKRKDAALVDETEDEASVTSESVVGNTFIIETVADTTALNKKKNKIVSNNSVTITDAGLSVATGSGLTRYGTKITKPVIPVHPSVKPEDQAQLQLLLSMTESSYISANDSSKSSLSSSIFGNIKAEQAPTPVIVIPSEIDDGEDMTSSPRGSVSVQENTVEAVKASPAPLKVSVGYDTRNRRSSDDNAKDYIISNIINTLRRHNSDPSPATPSRLYLTDDDREINDEDSDDEMSDAVSYHESYLEEYENLSPRYTPRTSTSMNHTSRENGVKPNPGKAIVVPLTQAMKPSNSLKSFRVSDEVKQLLGNK